MAMKKSAVPTDAESSISVLEEAKRLANHGRHPEARATFNRAIAASECPVARNEFGCYLSQVECFDEAIEQFAELMNWAKRCGNEHWRSVACNNLAGVYRTIGRSDLAARAQQLSIVAASHDNYETGGDEHLACDLANRATDAILARKYRLAEQLLRRSLLVETALGSLAGQAADWGNLGLLAALRGDLALGRRNLWRAYQMHIRAADHHGAGCDLMNLSDILRQQGQWYAAIRLLRRSIEQFEVISAHESATAAQQRLDEAIRVIEVEQRNPLLN
jgi:tetratricopeptide (TPR) repeat protein